MTIHWTYEWRMRGNERTWRRSDEQFDTPQEAAAAAAVEMVAFATKHKSIEVRLVEIGE